jgi:hypothetical protein
MKRPAELGQCRITRVPYHPKVTSMLEGVLQLRSCKPDHLTLLSEGTPYSRNKGLMCGEAVIAELTQPLDHGITKDHHQHTASTS